MWGTNKYKTGRGDGKENLAEGEGWGKNEKEREGRARCFSGWSWTDQLLPLLLFDMVGTHREIRTVQEPLCKQQLLQGPSVTGLLDSKPCKCAACVSFCDWSLWHGAKRKEGIVKSMQEFQMQSHDANWGNGEKDARQTLLSLESYSKWGTRSHWKKSWQKWIEGVEDILEQVTPAKKPHTEISWKYFQTNNKTLLACT